MLQPSKEHADEDHQHQDRRKHSKRIVIEEQDDQEQEQQATKRTYKEPSLWRKSAAPIHRKRTMCRSVVSMEEQAQFKSREQDSAMKLHPAKS